MSEQFSACLLCNRLVSLLTLRLKTGRLPILTKHANQVGYVYDRLVCFQVLSVSVHGLFGWRCNPGTEAEEEGIFFKT